MEYRPLSAWKIYMLFQREAGTTLCWYLQKLQLQYKMLGPQLRFLFKAHPFNSTKLLQIPKQVVENEFLQFSYKWFPQQFTMELATIWHSIICCQVAYANCSNVLKKHKNSASEQTKSAIILVMASKWLSFFQMYITANL